MRNFNATSVVSDARFLWLVIIAIVALVVRALFCGAPMGSDDSIYFNYAADLELDMFDTAAAQWPFRTGIVLPLALVQSLFGYSLTAYYVFSIGFSFAVVIMVYLLMLETCGQRAAIIASGLFATSSLALYHGTHVLPDTPNLFALLLCFFIFIRIKTVNAKRDRIFIVLAAAAAFYAHTVRMPNSVFLIALPAYEFLTYRSIKRTLYFSAALAGFIAVECVAYLIITGNPLKRIMLVPKGVTLWIKHQDKLSWTEYLFDPFTNLLAFRAGWVALAGGAIGLAIAIRDRAFELIALTLGGFLLFLAYSYPVTSFKPLVRALPLQPRYIVAFACVLTMLTGYALARIKVIPWIRRKVPVWIVPVFALVLVTCQARELPKLPNTLYFTDDAYVIGERLLKDHLKKNKINTPVRAYPGSVFKMFTGYSKLDLVEHSPLLPPKAGNYYLINRPRLIRSVRAARVRKDKRLVRYGEELLARAPNYEFVIDTHAISLFYIRPQSLEVVADLAKHPDVWTSQAGATRMTTDPVAFKIGKLDSHVYLSMFGDSFTKPTKSDHSIYKTLEPRTNYQVEVRYRNRHTFRSVRLFIREYDEKKSLQLVSHYIPTEAGEQVFRTHLSTSSDYKSFRFFLRVGNEVEDNAIHIDSITISAAR